MDKYKMGNKRHQESLLSSTFAVYYTNLSSFCGAEEEKCVNKANKIERVFYCQHCPFGKVVTTIWYAKWWWEGGKCKNTYIFSQTISIQPKTLIIFSVLLLFSGWKFPTKIQQLSLLKSYIKHQAKKFTFWYIRNI